MLHWLEICIKCEGVVVLALAHDPHALVLAYSLLKEVGLAFQGYMLHEVKWILRVVHLQNDTLNVFKDVICLSALHQRERDHHVKLLS